MEVRPGTSPLTPQPGTGRLPEQPPAAAPSGASSASGALASDSNEVLASLTALPSEAPPAPPPARKKKKKRGFFKRLGSALKGVAKGVLKVVTAPHRLALAVGKAVVKGVKQAAQAVGQFFKKYGTYILAGLQIACYCFPVLAPLGVALTAYQGVVAGKQMVQGIASGDWKMAVTGLLGVAGSFAGAASAVAKGAVGAAAAAGAKGLEATAKVVGQVADGVRAAQGAVQAARTGRIGSLAAGALGFVASNTEWLSDETLAVAQKVARYAKTAEDAVIAIKQRDFGIAAGALAGVAGDLGADLDLNAETRRAIARAGAQAQTAGAVIDAVRGRDLATAAGLVGGSLKDEKLGAQIATAGALAGSLQKGDVAAAAALGGAMVKDPKLGQAIATGGALVDGIRRRDLTRVVEATDGAASLLPADAEARARIRKAVAVARDVQETRDAARAGDLGGAARLAGSRLGGKVGDGLKRAADRLDEARRATDQDPIISNVRLPGEG
ncbi:MAG: hypothetical protein VKS61_10405 [Candidatus Sericytochromatia bacterium]|nr:hypothetical protein [Candidatus Sericytochromatia bacterium]